MPSSDLSFGVGSWLSGSPPLSPAGLSPALFPPPVLSAIPFSRPRVGSPLTLRCQTQLHPWRPASRLLFSFYKGVQALTDWDPLPELDIPEVQAEHSGCYRCKAALRAGPVQKDSPLLEIRVWGKCGKEGSHSPRVQALGDGTPGVWKGS